MTFVSVLYMFAFAVYVTLAGLIVIRNYRSRLSWACAGALTCMAIWSFGDIYHNQPSLPLERIHFFENVSSLGWATFPSAGLLFSLIMTRHRKLYTSWPLLAALLAVSMGFVYLQFDRHLAADFEKHSFGWVTVWSTSFWPVLYYVYFLGIAALIVYLLLDFRRRSNSRSERRSATIVLITSVVAVSLGTMSNIILLRLTPWRLPELGAVFGLIWGAGLYYAAVRHGLLSLTPQTAADAILATMPGSLFLVSPRGDIATANQAAVDLLGYPTTELNNRPMVSLSEDPSALRGILDRTLADGLSHGDEIQLRARDGRLIPVDVSARVMKDSNGTAVGVVLVMLDVSARKRAETALHESEERYHSFVDNFQGIAFVGTMDFRPLFFGGLVREITGYDASEFTSGKLRWNKVIHPDDIPLLKTNLEKVRSIPNYSTTREYRIIRKDGSVAWVREAIRNSCDSSGKPAQVQGAIYDISEHRRALDELLVLSQFRESIIDSADLLMAALDSERRIIVWSKAAEHITGYARSDVVGSRDIFKWLFPDPDTRAGLRQRMTESLPGGGVVDGYESVLVAKDGRRRTMSWYIRFLTTADGRFGGHIVLGRDVTEQRLAEAALRESEASFRALAENANDGIVVLSAEGFVLYINRRGGQIAGVPTEQLLGVNFRDFIRPQDAGWLEMRFAERVRGEPAPPHYPLTVLRNDGTEAHLEVTVAMTMWRGERSGLIVFRDVTARSPWNR